MYKNLEFEKIYGSEVDAIFRFCLVRVSNREQALDITQETFLRLWQSLMQDKKILNMKAFLFTISHRLIIDWYRKKKSISLEGMLFKDKEADNALVDETTAGPYFELGAEGRYLLEKVNDLDPTYRDSVYLRFAEGMSPREIGEILGISPNAASVRVNRGLIELRKNTGYTPEKSYGHTLRPSLS